MYVKTLNMFALGFFDSFIEHQQSKPTCPFQQIRHKNEANRGFPRASLLGMVSRAGFLALVSRVRVSRATRAAGRGFHLTSD